MLRGPGPAQPSPAQPWLPRGCPNRASEGCSSHPHLIPPALSQSFLIASVSDFLVKF